MKHELVSPGAFTTRRWCVMRRPGKNCRRRRIPRRWTRWQLPRGASCTRCRSRQDPSQLWACVRCPFFLFFSGSCHAARLVLAAVAGKAAYPAKLYGVHGLFLHSPFFLLSCADSRLSVRWCLAVTYYSMHLT